MKINYYPGTDSLFVKLKPGLEAEGSEVAPGIVFHYTPTGEVTAIDIDSKASELVDLSSLEVEGLPVGISPASRQESKAVLKRGIHAVSRGFLNSQEKPAPRSVCRSHYCILPR